MSRTIRSFLGLPVGWRVAVILSVPLVFVFSGLSVLTGAAERIPGEAGWTSHAGTTGLGAEAEDAPAGSVPRLNAISSRVTRRTAAILIETSEPVAYVTSQPDPLTVLVDLRAVQGIEKAQKRFTRVQPIDAVTVEPLTADEGETLARVRIALSRPAAHVVSSERRVIRVEVDRREQAGDPEATRSVEAARAPALPANAKNLQSVRASAEPEGTTIVLGGDGPLVAGSIELAKDLPPRLVLDFPNLSSSAPAVTDVGWGAVQRIRVERQGKPKGVRVAIDLARPAPYRVVPGGGEELKVVFEDGHSAEAAPTAGEPAVSATAQPAAPTAGAVPPGVPAVTAALDQVPLTDLTSQSAPAKPVEPPRAPAVAAGQAEAQPTQPPPRQAEPQPAVPGERQYTGHPVSLDFQGTDLRAVLRTFAEISGLNIVIDPSVQGTVDVALRDVPWDQALDIILRANQLGYTVDGTIVRIARLETLRQEEENRRKLQDARALAGTLQVLTRSLSYAKGEEVAPLLTRSALSQRGTVQVDPRTNTLIITDLATSLQTVDQLLQTLDRPQPQVQIEARIVQTNSDYARTLGVQWGLSGRVDPQLGNTTNLAFPNQGTLTGRIGGLTAPVFQGTPQEALQAGTPSAVNLGVPGASSAVGLALGAVNGAFNLDVALSALERSGNGRILSTPRVSTQNNVEAEISQGVEIPIQTISNNTVTVSFKDATLTLRVTPQITVANTVIMRIVLQNSSADFSRSINGIPPIDTQRALTQVLVNDGQTTVIGGIFIRREQYTTDRTPGLSRIPLFGWLFRRDGSTDENRELLIFITPRIIR